jgi:hypothetical protein
LENLKLSFLFPKQVLAGSPVFILPSSTFQDTNIVHQGEPRFSAQEIFSWDFVYRQKFGNPIKLTNMPR